MDIVALRFPSTEEQRELFYPTAYVDHGGQDWHCGGITYDGHDGSDFGVGSWDGMEEGREVVAAANGIVVDVHDGEYDRCTGESSECSGYGNYVFLRHADGRYSFYGHMSTDSIVVQLGEFVACGEHIGMVGSSGHSSGPHLHFEVREPDWSVVEPFQGRCGADSSSWVDQDAYDSTPLATCPSYPECTPVTTLSCGDAWSGRNDDPGSTDNVAWYGCTDGTEEGNEMLFQVATDRDEPVGISVTGLDVDLDLFLMPGTACDGEACLASSIETGTASERMQFDAVAGEPYAILVDGYAGAAGPFTLTVECEGSLPEGVEDTGVVVDSGDHDARPALATREEPGGGGCECGAVDPGSAWMIAAVLMVLRLRFRPSPPTRG